ncbi:MAG: hypothetical protein E7458_06595 [Ruminococcaceae bacterium]|nr:hypothetical protein [Oscillospiraceae bacterium]
MYWGMGLLLAILAFLMQWLLCRKTKYGWQRALGLLLPGITLLAAGVLYLLVCTVDEEVYLFGTHFLLVMVYTAMAAAAFGVGCGTGWILWLAGRKK